MKFSRIVTHLFADGGRIIKTSRIDYVEHVEKDDVSVIVRGLMKDQHRAMFTALRGGDLDHDLEKALGPLPEPPVAAPRAAAAAPALVAPPPAPSLAVPPIPVVAVEGPTSRRRDSRPSSERPQKRREISNPNLRAVSPSVAPPAPEAFDLDVAALERLPATRTPSRPPPRKKSRPPAVPRVAAPQRPATQLSNPPGTAARSIFGDGAVSEQTLDEVILSYLAEDLDGSGEE